MDSLISQKVKNGLGDQRNRKLSNAATKNRACESTLCIGFSLIPQAVFVFPYDKSLGQGQQNRPRMLACDSCDVVIMNILANQCFFFCFSFELL